MFDLGEIDLLNTANISGTTVGPNKSQISNSNCSFQISFVHHKTQTVAVIPYSHHSSIFSITEFPVNKETVPRNHWKMTCRHWKYYADRCVCSLTDCHKQKQDELSEWRCSEWRPALGHLEVWVRFWAGDNGSCFLWQSPRQLSRLKKSGLVGGLWSW